MWKNQAHARGQLFHPCRQEIDDQYTRYVFLVADGTSHFQLGGLCHASSTSNIESAVHTHDMPPCVLERLGMDKALSLSYGTDVNVQDMHQAILQFNSVHRIQVQKTRRKEYPVSQASNVSHEMNAVLNVNISSNRFSVLEVESGHAVDVDNDARATYR